jgi:hypothetical protein
MSVKHEETARRMLAKLERLRGIVNRTPVEEKALAYTLRDLARYSEVHGTPIPR